MGLIDSIHCKMKLPDNAPNFLKKSPFFQTSDLGKSCSDYVITEEGEVQISNSIMGNFLCEALGVDSKELPPVKVSWKRKKIEMYASNCAGGAPRNGEYVWFTHDGSDYIGITYVVQIRNGKVSSIKEKYREVKAARPISEFHK